CTVALNLYRQIVVYLAPVLPKLAADSAELLKAPCDRWELASEPLVGSAIGEFKHLMQRVDPEKVKQMIEASMDAESDAKGQNAAADTWNDSGEPLAAEPL